MPGTRPGMTNSIAGRGLEPHATDIKSSDTVMRRSNSLNNGTTAHHHDDADGVEAADQRRIEPEHLAVSVISPCRPARRRARARRPAT